MSYEYEHDVVSELEQFGVEYQSNAHYEMADEVRDVYAKARAFDEILNVNYIVAPDDYAHEVTKIVDKYMEDE